MKDSDEYFPDWLRPHKAEWHSAGTMSKLFSVGGLSVPYFISKVKAGGNTGAREVEGFTYYQVKRIYALARAHNLTVRQVVPKPPEDPDKRKKKQSVALMEKRIAYLTFKLKEAGDRLDDLEGRLDGVVSAIRRLPTDRSMRGVYFVMADDGVAYVGSSDNVSRRLDHPSTALLDVRVLPVENEANHREIEAAFIRLLRPRLNKTHNA